MPYGWTSLKCKLNKSRELILVSLNQNGDTGVHVILKTWHLRTMNVKAMASKSDTYNFEYNDLGKLDSKSSFTYPSDRTGHADNVLL